MEFEVHLWATIEFAVVSFFKPNSCMFSLVCNTIGIWRALKHQSSKMILTIKHLADWFKTGLNLSIRTGAYHFGGALLLKMGADFIQPMARETVNGLIVKKKNSTMFYKHCSFEKESLRVATVRESQAKGRVILNS